MAMLSLLTACGGSDDTEGSRFVNNESTDSGSDGEDSVIDEGELTNVSYLPLMTIERYKEWYDDTNQDVFLVYRKDNRLNHFTINPVNASTLAPITTATASDFTILEDDIPVNPKVSFPLLQRVIGNNINLTTAIVINTSSAMDGVDKDAFIQEVKDYVAAAKASSTYYIANQAFTVWGYDGIAVEETGGYQTSTTNINNALDTVLANWKSAAYRQNTGSNYTYDALVQAIGRYKGDGAFSVTGGTLQFRDSLSAENNDLVEFITPDVTYVTSVVLFSAGFGSPNRFDEEFAVKALESQSTLVYEQGVELAGADTQTINYPKTFIYVVPDGNQQDSVLANKASSVVTNTISGGAYNFASSIVAAQKAHIDVKTAADNQHVLRWASMFRAGTGHTQVVKTRTPEDKYGYTLSTDNIDIEPAEAIEVPQPQVEITGANNEYLAAGVLSNTYNSAVAYANEITRFYPATRWTNQTFTASDYAWSSTPAAAFTANSDGSVTINTASLPITLTLTNNNIDFEGGTISDDFTLTIYASK